MTITLSTLQNAGFDISEITPEIFEAFKEDVNNRMAEPYYEHSLAMAIAIVAYEFNIPFIIFDKSNKHDSPSIPVERESLLEYCESHNFDDYEMGRMKEIDEDIFRNEYNEDKP